MKGLSILHKFFRRLRYPKSLPEEVTQALGISLNRFATFEEFVHQLTTTYPVRIKKYMKREEVEKAFHLALRKEHFRRSTLFSYSFPEGWIGFSLSFDENSCLRRVHLQHRLIPQDRGIEIPLQRATSLYCDF